jgi:amino acid transporter
MLKRGIQKWDLVLLVINSIIGAGIFGLPSRIFGLSGSWSLLAFFVCAIAIMMFIFCFAEVSSRFDTTGGPYLYAMEAFGGLPGFLTGWLLLLSHPIIPFIPFPPTTISLLPSLSKSATAAYIH